MKTYMVSSEVRAVVTPTGITLVDLLSGEILRGDRLGCLVWLGIAERRTIEHIIQQIAEHYSLPVAGVKNDVQEFINELANRTFVFMEKQEPVSHNEGSEVGRL